MSLIMKRKADLTIGKFTMSSLRNKYMKPTISYYASPLIIVVPVGEAFTSLEKLLKPFGSITWAFVVAVLLITFLFISFVKWRFSKHVQTFIFGESNTSPHLNTLNVFLGGSLNILPTTTFARTLLGIFLFYSLIITSSYTGSLFNFIKADVLRKPSFNSINEMVDQDFKFYMIPSAQQLTAGIPKLFNRRVVIKVTEVPRIRSKMIDPTFKGGMLSSLEQIVYFNMINRHRYTLNVCQERLFNFQYSIYLQKNSYLDHRFDLELLQYLTNGLIDRAVNQFVQMSFMKSERTKKNLQDALKLEQLMGCFWILIVGNALATFVGCLECFSRKNLILKNLFEIV